MCGIAGLLRRDGGPASRERVQVMTDALIHRGPDGEGILELGPVVFGHRRLAVIDLSPRAAQPMRLEERGLTLTYNGEVYNYRELRAELEAAGETFRSESDTEVVLRAYARWGEEAFARFNGMWALALWDAPRRRLVLSRDRFGIKPLYLLEGAGRLAFASEPKALLAAFPEASEPDLGVLARFLHSGVQDDGPRTFFARIRQLSPGHTLTLDLEGRRSERRYWSLSPEAGRERLGGRDAAEVLRELLGDAVALRMRSDVPVGTCLSGGLDSSTVVALAARATSTPVRTFTATYDDPACDERGFARAVAQRYGCHALEVTPNPGREFVERVDRIGWFHDEPCSRPGLIAQWSVMELAAGHVKVLLDGQGGDELLLGYVSYAWPYLRSLAGEAARTRDPALVAKWLRDARGLLSQPTRTPLGDGPVWRQLARSGLQRLRRDRPALLTPDLLAAAASVRVERTGAAGLNTIDRFMRDDLAHCSLPALLHHEDRMSMAFSIEARVPFLDHRVAELAFAMDFKEKVDGPFTKSVLRRAAGPLLPEAIVQRRDKLGYPIPLRAWLSAAADDVRGVLLDGLAPRGFVPERTLSQAWSEFVRGSGDPWLIYRWLTTELWARRFVDGGAKVLTDSPR